MRLSCCQRQTVASSAWKSFYCGFFPESLAEGFSGLLQSSVHCTLTLITAQCTDTFCILAYYFVCFKCLQVFSNSWFLINIFPFVLFSKKSISIIDLTSLFYSTVFIDLRAIYCFSKAGISLHYFCHCHQH